MLGANSLYLGTLSWLAVFSIVWFVVFWIQFARRAAPFLAKLANSEILKLPMDSSHHVSDTETRNAISWAEAANFEYLGVFEHRPDKNLIYAWKSNIHRCFLASYVLLQGDTRIAATDFVTGFQDEFSLTTNNHGDGRAFPKHPATYAQCFANASIDEIWRRHKEAEQYLVGFGGVRAIQQLPDFQPAFQRAIRDQMNYLQSFLLWKLRIPYWYFVYRKRWRNISIEEQHTRGWIKLPNELEVR